MSEFDSFIENWLFFPAVDNDTNEVMRAGMTFTIGMYQNLVENEFVL